MAHLFRLILVLLLPVLGANVAMAAVPKVDGFRVQYGTNVSMVYLTLAGACGDPLAETYAKQLVRGQPGAYTSHQLRVEMNGPTEECAVYGFGGFARPEGTWVGAVPIAKSVQICPANSTASQIGNGCQCDKGYFELGGQCVSAETPDAKCAGDFNMSGFGVGNGTLSQTVTLKGDVPSGTMCHPHSSPTSGCTVQFRADKVVEMPDGSKQTIGQYGMYKGPPGEVQGKACDIPAEQPGEGTEVEANCKKSGYAGSESVGGRKVCLDAPECPGGFGGEVNGVSVCVKDEGTNIVKSEKKTEKKNADGSTEKKTEKTTCQGKECKTETTTTTTPAGGGSSVTNVTNVSQSKDDYCKNNADSAQCKGDSKGDGKDGGGSFGGSCEGGFTCEGDALQCAQLKEQYKHNCETMGKDKDANSLTNKALNGTDDKSADAMKESAGQVNVGSSFDQTGLGWVSSCPADPTIPLNFGGRGGDLVIPFSRICGPLGVLSLAGVGITLLGCGVWVLGGKKES
ncbi:hypothetical protein [Comamonas sp. C11]|uniref:hypothetical protein n=1 Tax=Comamonas sp. C11 TaxID=2966554 RepID=UPI0021123327|nr:hypothetical protein [Comamonas sp. C11]UUC96126.1 hypothetical protein NOX35_12895 [Comamonas sp. C11]